jgi:HEPN domain-containing protein
MDTGLNEWKMYIDHGKAFYKYAVSGLNRPEKFNEDALFNLAAMAIEKLSIGFLMGNSVLPRGHSFQNLVDSMNQVVPLPHSLKEEITRLDIYQENVRSKGI